LLYKELTSVFGWRVSVGANTNPRFLRNFPMQANGAEMLRLACCLATEAGIRVCAPMHDALLVEATLAELDDVVAKTQRLMAEASSVVLGGFELRTEVQAVRAPNRWHDPKGQAIWSALESITCWNDHLFASATDPAQRRTPVPSPYMYLRRIARMPPIETSTLRLGFRSISGLKQRPPRPQKGQSFLKGPIPLDWLCAAVQLPGKSLHVGIAIWYRAGLMRSGVVPLSNLAGARFGLDRNAKYRALEWLEKANLVVVDRKPGRAPSVTICALTPLDDAQDLDGGG
jgi:hypothetical protein